MVPQPADKICLSWSGRKKVSVALLGTRSTVVPNAYGGLNTLATWLGVVSIRMVWARISDAKTAITAKRVMVVEDRAIPGLTRPLQALFLFSKACKSAASFRDLERQLQRYLPNSTITRPGYLAEVAGSNITRRTRERELGMVEDVEKLRSELERRPLSDGGVFVQGQVPVVDSGAMEEAPPRIACNPDIFRSKRACGKELVAG